MIDQKNTKFMNAVVAGAIGAVVFVTILTIAGDLYPPLKKLLKDAHQHHWVGKGIWSAIFFVFMVAVYMMAAKAPGEGSMAVLLKRLSWAISIGTILLFLFFMYESF